MAEIVPPVASPIVVPANETPTYLNGGALDGALIGGVLGGESGLAGAAIGGVIGGALGKEQMERDYRNGRVVRPPHSLGTVMIIEALIIGAAAAIGAAIFSASAPAIVGLGLLGVVVGGFTGMVTHEYSQRAYANAQQYYVNHGGNYQGREREAQLASQVTQAEAQLLAQRLAAGKGVSYTQQVADGLGSATLAR